MPKMIPKRKSLPQQTDTEQVAKGEKPRADHKAMRAKTLIY